VESGIPSRTSQAVALTRAAMDRPHTPDGDPDAQRRLCAGMAPTRRRPALEARTRFFDAEVLAAVSAGLPQVVICGAGYDDRALRFAAPGTRFFELDHPATQVDKARRLQSLQTALALPVLVPADFRDAGVAELLAAAGHDAGRPTLFLCEGLLIYLARDVIQALLASLRSRAADGSWLAASLATHPPGLDSGRVAAAMNAGRARGGTEPWVTIMPSGDYLALLRGAGWAAAGERSPQAGEGTGRGSLFVVAEPVAGPPGG